VASGNEGEDIRAYLDFDQALAGFRISRFEQ
jgi:hypothetical protein